MGYEGFDCNSVPRQRCDFIIWTNDLKPQNWKLFTEIQSSFLFKAQPRNTKNTGNNPPKNKDAMQACADVVLRRVPDDADTVEPISDSDFCWVPQSPDPLSLSVGMRTVGTPPAVYWAATLPLEPTTHCWQVKILLEPKNLSNWVRGQVEWGVLHEGSRCRIRSIDTNIGVIPWLIRTNVKRNEIQERSFRSTYRWSNVG